MQSVEVKKNYLLTFVAQGVGNIKSSLETRLFFKPARDGI
jgi:hypothetical protein